MTEYNFRHFRVTHLVEEGRGISRLHGPKPGDVAPDFELLDTNGEPWNLRVHRGRPVLLHFGSYT